MNYRCKACEAHIDLREVMPYMDAILAQFGGVDKENPISDVCPYCGEHELKSIEGEDDIR